MALNPLTPDQEVRFWDDRRPALYGSLISLLVLNNIFVVLRCIGRYRTKRAGQRRLAAEDPLIVLTGVSTRGLGVKSKLMTRFSSM
jgi:hypothetical protein